MADAKLTALTEDTSPSASGLIYYVDDPTGAANPRKVSIENFLKAYFSPDGTMVNGKLSVTVSANDLIVALKTITGTDPSASDPVYVRINGTVRKCTAALSKTLADGTSWFGSGAAELGTKEIDYFVYAIWNTTPATDIMDLGFARVPFFSVYSEASATTTNEKYLAYANGSAPTSTDDMVNIGRFAATLSLTGTGHLWTVPTFTSTNLVNRPTFETRVLSYAPTLTNVTEGNGTKTGVYQRVGNRVNYDVTFTLGNTSSVTGAITISLPTTPATHGATYLPSAHSIIRDVGVGQFPGIAPYTTGNTIILYAYSAGGTYAAMVATSGTVPMTWTTTDEFSVSGTYIE